MAKQINRYVIFETNVPNRFAVEHVTEDRAGRRSRYIYGIRFDSFETAKAWVIDRDQKPSCTIIKMI